MTTIYRKSGFTLFELIVSMAITSVIALFVFSFATSLARVWRNSESGVSTELDAQIALDMIAQDLESAYFKEADANAPMFAVSAISKTGNTAVDHGFSGRWDPVSVSGSGRPDTLHFDPADHYYGWAGVWLRFFTAAPSVNAVGYQIIRRTAFADDVGRPRYLLHRAVVRHDHTLAAGFNITDAAYSATTDSDSSPGVIQSPWRTAIILEDVVDFGVRLYVYDKEAKDSIHSPDGLRLIFPSEDNSTTLSDQEYEHLASSFSSSELSTFDIAYPDVVEVFLRVLDDAGSEALHRSEEVELGSETYQQLLDDHSRVYSRMVRLPGREAKG